MRKAVYAGRNFRATSYKCRGNHSFKTNSDQVADHEVFTRQKKRVPHLANALAPKMRPKRRRISAKLSSSAHATVAQPILPTAK